MCLPDRLFTTIMATFTNKETNNKKYDGVDVISDKERFFPNNADDSQENVRVFSSI